MPILIALVVVGVAFGAYATLTLPGVDGEQDDDTTGVRPRRALPELWWGSAGRHHRRPEHLRGWR
ncbi:MAG: hypothetical protein ABIQ53_12715 [Terracoccus sp.]